MTVMSIKVKAKQLGYYDLKRRREGDIFELADRKGFRKDASGKLTPMVVKAEDQFSEKWMERVDAHVPVQSRPRPKAFSKAQEAADAEVIGAGDVI